MSDTLIIGGTTYNNVAGFKATDSGDNELTFVRPTGTKQIGITENGTTTEDVTNYASAEITVNVQGGGGDVNTMAMGTWPAGNIVLDLTGPLKTTAFIGCKQLTGVVFNTVPSNTRLDNTFYDCSALTEVDLGDVYEIANSAFRGCTSLKHIESTEVLRLTGMYAYQDSGIKRACFPSITYLVGRHFQYCHTIELADVGNVDQIRSYTFGQAESLRTLIIRRSSVTPLSSWSVNDMGGIYSNPTASTVYVLSALLTSYQQAANWSAAYAAGVTFAALEGSPYESTTWYENVPVT